MPQSAYVFDVGESDFPQAVIERSRQTPVVVDFWASWCGPCRMLAPLLEKLVEERQGQVLLAKVNVDEAPQLAAAFRIESIPHIVAFRDGRPVLDFLGLLPEAQLRDFLDRILPTEADRVAQRGAELEPSDPAEAEKLYRQALAEEANQETALVGLARLLLARDQEGEAKELLDRLGPGSSQAEEVERLNGIVALRELTRPHGSDSEILRRAQANPDDAQTLYAFGCSLAGQGKYEDALEKLLAAGQRDKQMAQGQVREAMVSIFKVVGVRSPLADAYRDKLARILY